MDENNVELNDCRTLYVEDVDYSNEDSGEEDHMDVDDLENISLTAVANSPGNEFNGENICPPQFRSPIKTVKSYETFVSTNKVTTLSVVESPKVGMVFNGWKEIEYYYKTYAQQKGFGVSRVAASYSNNKESKLKERRGMSWRCECWGAPDMRAKREAKKRAKAMDVGGCSGNVNGVIGEAELDRGKRKSKKCHCPARIYGSVNRDGHWALKTIVLEHVHKVSPSKSKLVKEYRMKNLTSKARKRLLNYFDEGVPVSQIRGCLATENDNLPNLKDLQHEVYKERRLKMEGGDAKAMMAYFEFLQSGNQHFFHAHRLDDEGRLKDVIWVDARSRAAYEDFGDAVCFDATYLTNEYELPFCNFVGVNHHGQSILLGCALVSHEDSDTFRWIFQQWLLCMGNKAPLGILTDQAAAMRKPIAEIMPNTVHRWCIWHILKKFPEKLGKCSKYTEFKSPLKRVIYESFSAEEFDNRWCAFMKEYKLEENEWLKDLYVERHMWVPAYMREHFCAGMKTTQRVESINSFFDGFINRHTKLYEFPRKYCKAMKKRIGDEVDADARDSKYIRRLVSGFKVERIFQKIYTDAKFQEVQKECSRMMYVTPKHESIISDEEIHYVVEDRVWIVPEGESEDKVTDYRRFYSVVFNPVNKDVSCDCSKFVNDGIPCKHCIRIWDHNLVAEVPQKYILQRWRKDVVRRHTRVKVGYHDPSETDEVQRYNKLLPELEALCEEASVVDDATVEVVQKAVSQLRIDVKERHTKHLAQNAPELLPSVQYPNSEIASNTSHEASNRSTPMSVSKPQQDSIAANLEIKDPKIRKKPRGRPKGSRNKTLAETGYKCPKAQAAQDKQSQAVGKGGGGGDPVTSKLPVKRKNTNVYNVQNTEEVPDDDILLSNGGVTQTSTQSFMC